MAKVTPIDHAERRTVPGGPGRGDTFGSRRPSIAVPKDLKITVAGTLAKWLCRKGHYENPICVSTRRFLYSRTFSIGTMVALGLALFLSDILVLAQSPSNTEVDVVLTIVFLLFALEFSGLTITDASYPFGFFFWMDLIGTFSMIFDISYMLGIDATKPVIVGQESAGESLVVVRAARAAKLGARAGRLSRVLKVLRFLPGMQSGDSDTDMRGVKMAKVISNKLTNVLSTRVALQAMLIVVVLPLVGIFQYPLADDSLATWAELLARTYDNYRSATALGNDTGLVNGTAAAARALLNNELEGMSEFYSEMAYGPFDVCYGETIGGRFVCLGSLNLQSLFPRPRRNGSIWEVSSRSGSVQVSYNLSVPRQQEAAASIGLIFFMVLIMCVFGMVLSSSITVIALQPLERMLTAVRQRCAQIFKYTNDLQDPENEGEEASQREDDDVEQVSEFMLLEKVVMKLAAIANISTAAEVEIKEGMNENDMIMLNWMHCGQVAGDSAQKGSTRHPTLATAVSHMDLNSRHLLANFPTEVLNTIGTEDFNSLDLSKELKISVSTHIITSLPSNSAWTQANVDEMKLLKFVGAVESRYKDNAFHNFAHGLDVLHTVQQFLFQVNAEGVISESSQFWLMIAAIGHDVGHLGLNNQYLVEASHELALKYNDRSPMENMHCALLFRLASDAEADVFSQFDKGVFKEMRKGIITAILHTDMVKHNDMVKEMNLLYQMSSDAFDALSPGTAVAGSQVHTQLMVNALLHGADISNPAKPWELCKRIAYLILDEFFAQGDLEKAAGMPVQMLNDRDKVNKPNSQVGFIEFVIAPMVEVMVSMFPQLDSLSANLSKNVQHWAEVWQEETGPTPDAVAKVTTRVQRVVGRCEAVMRDARFL